MGLCQMLLQANVLFHDEPDRIEKQRSVLALLFRRSKINWQNGKLRFFAIQKLLHKNNITRN